VDRRRLLIYTQVVAGVAALGLATLVWTGNGQQMDGAGILFCYRLLHGVGESILSGDDVLIWLDAKILANAVALNSSQFQLSRVVGPALAGVGFGLFGLAGCFYVQTDCRFAAVVISLRMVRFERDPHAVPAPAHAVNDRHALWKDLLEGFRYVRNRPRVSSLLMISCGQQFFLGAPYFSMIPIYARDIFHLGATGLAWLMGTAGAGAFCGAALLTVLGDFRRKGWFVLGGSLFFGAGVTAFALSTHLHLTYVFLFCLGFAIVLPWPYQHAVAETGHRRECAAG